MRISISEDKLKELKGWFTNYVRTFQCNEVEMQQNMDLKENHTARVCLEILAVGKRLGLDADALRLAEIIALLHDVGRFEQYARYKTFVDRNSENHAEAGIRTLKKFGVLESFDPFIKEIILRAIQCHNRALLPKEATEPFLFYAKLIRDADKLDIWKVVTDYYHRKDQKRNGAIELDLPDTPGFSDEVYQDLINKRIVNINHVKSLNDFKLLHIGWIFDVNFQPTFDCVKERRYLEMIRDVLPESKKIDEVFAIIHAGRFF